MSYDGMLDALVKTKAAIVTANVPDLTEIAYFTPLATFAAQAGLPPQMVAAKLGIGIHDYLRPSAAPIAVEILSGKRAGLLPATCPVPFPAIPSSTIPCVLTASDASRLRLAVDQYNTVIRAESASHGAVMVDMHGLVNRIYRQGYRVNGKLLTTDFLHGLFSLDGFHPTNTGYAIVANEFIRTMNFWLGTDIPLADVSAIAAKDPLVPPIRIR